MFHRDRLFDFNLPIKAMYGIILIIMCRCRADKENYGKYWLVEED